MINRISAFFDKLTQAPSDQEGGLSSKELPIATAALLIEVAAIDRHLDDSELNTLSQSLAQRFDLNEQELIQLVDQAKKRSSEASSLYQFTQKINQYCDDDEKYHLACQLWDVAYADSVLDKHEEHIIRRIADLIHLRHSDFIRAKHTARDKAQPE